MVKRIKLSIKEIKKNKTIGELKKRINEIKAHNEILISQELANKNLSRVAKGEVKKSGN